MDSNKNRQFKWKGFVSFLALFTIIMISATGIVLYFTPPGRIANWSHWTFLGLEKSQWQAVHTIFSFTFVFVTVFHLYFNWKVLMSYFKKKLQTGLHLRRELLWSSILTLLFFIFTLVEIPPFSTIMVWSEDLSNSWASEESEPPIPHAERLTLVKLAETTNHQVSEIMQKLNNQGIKPTSEEEIVGDLAKRYNITPKELFDKIELKAPTSTSSSSYSGGGFGRKTVAQICAEANITLEDGLNKLKQEKIKAKSKDNIRELADDYSLLPIEIVEIIRE